MRTEAAQPWPTLPPWKPGELSGDQLEGLEYCGPRVLRTYVSPRFKYPSDYRPSAPSGEITLTVHTSMTATKQVTTELISGLMLRERFLPGQEVTELFRQERWQKYLQRVARSLYIYHRPAMNRKGYFATRMYNDLTNNPLPWTMRCEDVESLLWEAIWFGYGKDRKSLKLYIGARVKDWEEHHHLKYPIEIISLPDPMTVIERYDVERIRDGWKRTKNLDDEIHTATHYYLGDMRVKLGKLL